MIARRRRECALTFSRIAILVCGTGSGLSLANADTAAFNYTPFSEPIFSATLTIDTAEWTAHRTIGGQTVNRVSLSSYDGSNSVDLSSEFFGAVAWPAAPLIDQGSEVTGLITADIPVSFFADLHDGGIGLQALLTDTDDAIFAIDTIFLTIVTAGGIIQPHYGSSNDGFRLGLSDNDMLPYEASNLTFTGTGFDEPISSKHINVPEPASSALLILLAGLCITRRRSLSTAAAALMVVSPLTVHAGSPQQSIPAPNRRASSASAQPGQAAARPDNSPLAFGFVPGEVLFVYDSESPRSTASLLLSAVSATEIQYFPELNTYHAHVPQGWTVAEMVDYLRQQPGVIAASPNYIHYPAGHLTEPNDTEFARQWYLNNRGNNMVGDARVPGPQQLGVIDADIDAPQAWEFGTDCSSEIVAVFDAGVDISHPDFGGPHSGGGNIWENPVDNLADGADGDNNGVVDDNFGANFIPTERHAERFELFVDRREFWVDSDAVAGLSAGDSVYWDSDGTANVSAADTRLQGPVVANGTGYLLFGGTHRHAENVNANGIFDGGETIYDDIGANAGVVDAGDTRISGPAQANGTALIAFHNGNNAFDAADSIYSEIDNSTNPAGSFTVSAGDLLLRGPAAGNGSTYNTFAATIRHVDPNSNGAFDGGEAIYNDVGGTANQVDAGDALLVGPGAANGTALISFCSPDGVFQPDESIYVDVDSSFTRTAGDTLLSGPALAVGATLTNFAGNELYVDANNNRRFDNGETIYRDVGPNAGVVDAGDVRLAGAAAANGTALRAFGIWPDNNIADVTGHGTNCAGLILARGNNNRDIAGVCWRGKLMTVKIAGTSGSTDASFVAGVNYVIDFKRNRNQNVRIINYSFGGPSGGSVTRAAIQAAGNEGILFLIAAGNDATDNDADGQYSETIYIDRGPAGAGPPNNIVNAGDTRITPFGQPGSVLPAGGVGGLDADVGLPLTQINTISGGIIRHDERINANGSFDAGERIYFDLDNNNSVSSGDVRRAFFISGGVQYPPGLVAAGDADVGTALVNFTANERFADRFMQGFGGRDLLPAGQAATFPCSFDLNNIICVAATTNADRLTNFSGWGLISVDVAAPGLDILTLRRATDGGGTVYVPGTSFATPIVAGICTQLWSRAEFANYTLAELRAHLLLGQSPRGIGHDHGVDPRFGLRNTVVSGINNDGRARMLCGDELGDAPDFYATTVVANGPRHEDMGEEWLGRDGSNSHYDAFADAGPPGSDVSPEWEAIECCWPPDPDRESNLNPVNTDHHDDGIDLIGPFTFSPAGGPANVAKVRVWITTENNDVADGDQGRYPLANGTTPHNATSGVHGNLDDKHLWVNAWFDWNRDGDWDDANEHVFLVKSNPTLYLPDKSGVYDVEFDMPPAPANIQSGSEVWARFRLDYGENAGQDIIAGALPNVLGPSGGGTARYWNDAGGLPLITPNFNLYESVTANPGECNLSVGVAEFGEVEDYLVSASDPDQLHLLGPIPNEVPVNSTGTIDATVESQFNGLIGLPVRFETLMGEVTYLNGSNPGGTGPTTLTTDNYGRVRAEFRATETGFILINATVPGTNLTAFSFFEVVEGEPVQRNLHNAHVDGRVQP